MSHKVNLVRVLTAATGNSTPITLGARYSTLFMTPAEAGAIDGRTYSYLIVDGNDFEYGRGIYTASGTTLSRNVIASRVAGTLGTTRLNLSGTAQVRFNELAEDMDGVRGTRAVTTTSDVLMNSDHGYVVTFSNASAIAASLAQAGAANAFLDGWTLFVKNKGAGAVTITPATSTIDGAATLVLTQNQGALIWSDGTNYQSFRLGSATIGTTAGTVAAGEVVETIRQNSLHDRIYQSKLLGDVRRVLNSWTTGFKASTDALRGIASGSNIDVANAPTSGYVVASGSWGGATFLSHFDGSNGSTSFTDVIGGVSITAVGDAKISTAASKFGGASLIFDGTGDAVQLNSSTAFSFGTGDFTIDFWFMRSSGTTAYLFDGRNTDLIDDIFPTMYISGSNLVYYVNGAVKITGASTIANGTWYHIEISRSGSTTKMFLNGTQEGSSYTDTNNYVIGGNRLVLGAAGNLSAAALNGYIDEFRVSKGVAQHTSNFTAPSAAYASTPGNMTLVTTSQTADASVSNARVLLEIDNAASPTLNTDLTVEVTCNGGTNWTAAALSLVGTGQSGRKIIETVDQACTGGTSFAARIKTLNNKSVPIHGVSVTVR